MSDKLTTAPEFTITIGGNADATELALKPSLKAMTLISRRFGGMGEARARLAAEDLDAICYVINAGANLADKDQKKTAQRVYDEGISMKLLGPLIRYVACLGNAGKPVPEVGEDGEDAAGTDAPADAGGNA